MKTADRVKKLGRECGTCYACCTALGIEELRKYPGQACRHLDGTVPEARCTIYERRPTACSNYYCAWLAGMGTDAYRPDRCGFLVTLYPSTDSISKFSATVHVLDMEKSGAVTDPASLLSNACRALVEEGCDDIRILKSPSRVGSPIIHFHNGFVRQGVLIKSRSKDDSKYEDLSYATKNPPVGRYMVAEVAEVAEVKKD